MILIGNLLSFSQLFFQPKLVERKNHGLYIFISEAPNTGTCKNAANTQLVNIHFTDSLHDTMWYHQPQNPYSKVSLMLG